MPLQCAEALVGLGKLCVCVCAACVDCSLDNLLLCCLQVTQQGSGTPHWNVYSAPPAAVAGVTVAGSSSQEGQDLSRQLFS